MKINKKLTIFVLDLLMLFSTIGLLYFIRIKFKEYMNQIFAITPSLVSLKDQLQTEALSNIDVTQASNLLNSVDLIIKKAFFLNLIVLPIGLFIFYIIFEGTVWKLLTKISFKRFILYSIPSVILLYLTVIVGLKHAGYILLNEGSNMLALTLLSVIILVIVYYFTLVLYSRNNSFKNNVIFAIKNIKRLALPYLILVIISFFIFMLILILYILLLVNLSVILSLVLLIIILICHLFVRNWFIKKV